MARSFNLTAEINLRAPGNLKTVVAEIRRELGTVSANVNLKVDPKAAKSVSAVKSKLDAVNAVLVTARSNTDALNTSLQSLSSALTSVGSAGSRGAGSIKVTAESAKTAAENLKVAASGMEEFGKQSFLAVKRFAAFSVVTSGIYGLINAINSGFAAFVTFDKELVRLQQVTGKSASELRVLEKTITDLSVNLGVSSESLTQVAVTLAQAGLTANETRIALAALAKTELAPSFDSLAETTEGAIAALRQFDLQASDLESALGSVNAVAAAFAVEADDLIAAIQRTGGVFAAASKGVSEGTDALNEFLALFTSVRQTTRESAETIATGLRTIFTRIQRAKTIDQLREFGIELTDLEGKFVGPFEAVRRLSEGLKQLDPRDIRFSSIVEELGGFRQIGKVIPLIQQFAVAQEALKVAQKGQGSLADAQVIAQKSLANQLAKVREQFLSFIRDVGKSEVFQSLFKIVLNLTSGLISLASAFKPILPILAIVGAIKGVKAVGDFATGFFGAASKGSSRGAGESLGSSISGAKDKERADATAKASEAIKANTSALTNLTSAVQALTSKIGSAGGSTTLNSGGKVMAFARGGVVPGSGNRDTVPAMLMPGEFVIRKKAVETIGTSNLQKINKYADGGKVVDAVGNLTTVKGGSRIKLGIGGIQESDQVETTVVPQPISLKQNDFDELLNLIKKDYISNIDKYKKFSKSTVVDGNTPQSLFSQKNLDLESLNLPLPRPPAQWAKGNAFQQLLIKKYGLSAPYSVDQNDSFEEIVKEHFAPLDFENGDAKFEKGVFKYFSNKQNSDKVVLVKRLVNDQDKLPWTDSLDLFTSGNKGPLNSTSIYYPENPQKTKSDFDSYYNDQFNKEVLKNANNTNIPISDVIKARGFNFGGKIQKFMIGGKALGARSQFKELDDTELSKLSTEDLIKYAKAQAYDVFSTRGAGMAVASEFIEVPQQRIIPELDSSLVSYMGKRGFWREKVAAFGRPIATQDKSSAVADRSLALEKQIARQSDEVAARSQNWTSIRSGSDIDNYLLSSLQDPILSDYKAVREGNSLSKPFHNTRLRKAVNSALDNYDDFDYSAANIDKLVSGMAAKRFAYGGLIQKFANGATVESIGSIPEDILKRIDDLGGPGPIREAVGVDYINQIIKSQLSGRSITAKQLLSPKKLRSIPNSATLLPAIEPILEKVESQKKAEQEEKQAQIARNLQAASGGAYKFGLASIFGPNGEFGYSDVSDAKEIEGKDGEKYLTQIVQKSLPQRYSGVIQQLKQQLMSAPQTAAENLQYVDIFGTGGPLAFDFDETLVKGADIFTPQGAIDFQGYNDPKKVQEALSNAELTFLGQELQQRLIKYPQLLDSIRILTARPPSNVPYLADTLSRLELPIPESKITGVSGGLNKVKNLSELETLIDDNLENISSVLGGGKKAIRYQEAKPIDMSNPSSSKSISVMEGYALEEMVKSLGVPISADDADPNRPIDFPNGLGASARYWDMPSTIPTDTKRTNSSNAVGRLFEEAQRFYVQNFKLGGEVYQSGYRKDIEKQIKVLTKQINEGKQRLAALKSNDIKPGVIGKLFGKETTNPYQNEIWENEEFIARAEKRIAELSASLMPQKFALGGLADASTEMSGLMSRLYGNMGESDKKPAAKKQKNFGQIALRTGDRIQATYMKQGMDILTQGLEMRSGQVIADKINSNLYAVQSSAATKGYGPKLYDVVMEAATEQGAMLTSDRRTVSEDAKRVWAYYFNNRSDVNKTPLDPTDWTSNSRLVDPKLYGKPETWPPFNDPAWILQTGYSKSPSDINNMDLVQRLANGGPVDVYHGSNTGPNNEILESFKTKGVQASIAQGYGQGSGFYVWSDKDTALKHAKSRIAGDITTTGETGGRPMVVQLTEILDPSTWDLDYETNKNNIISWLYNNFDKIKNNIMPDRSQNVPGIKRSLKMGEDIGLQLQNSEGRMKSIYASGESDLASGEYIGQIISRLQSQDPSFVQNFEKEFFDNMGPGIGIKYVGNAPLNPSDIKTFANGGSTQDTVPALLTPGEFVINKKAAQKIGYGKLERLNKADKIQGYNKGGYVGGIQAFAFGGTVQDQDYFAIKAKQAGQTLDQFAKSLIYAAKDMAKGLQDAQKAAKLDLKAISIELSDKYRAAGSGSETDKAIRSNILETIANKIREINPELDATSAKNLATQIADKMSSGDTFESLVDASTGIVELKAVMEKNLSSQEAQTEALKRISQERGLSPEVIERLLGDRARGNRDNSISRVIDFFGGPLKVTTRSLLLAASAFEEGAKYIYGAEKLSAETRGALGAVRGGAQGAAVVAEMDVGKNVNEFGKFLESFGGRLGSAGQGLQKFSGAIQAGAIAYAAVSGAIKGFYQALNQAKLEQELQKLSLATDKTTEAFRRLEKTPTATNATLAQQALGQEMEAVEGLRRTAAVDIKGRRTLETARSLDITGITSAVSGQEQEKDARKAFFDVSARRFEQFGTLGARRLNEVDPKEIEQAVADANRDDAVITRLAKELEDLQAAPARDEAAIKSKQTEIDIAQQSKAENLFRKSQRFGQIAALEGEQEALRQFYLNQAQTEEEKNQRLKALNGRLGDTDKERADNQQRAIDAAKRLAAAEAETELRTKLLADATQKLNLQTENLLRTYSVASAILQRFGESINLIKDSAGATAAALEGRAQIGNIDRTNENILGNIEAYSLEEVRAAAVQTGQLAGGGLGGQTLQNQVLTAKVLQEALPQALATTGSEDVGEVINKLEDAFNQAGVAFSEPIKEDLRGALQAEANKDQGVSFQKLAQESDIVANLLKQTEAGLKAAQEFQKRYNDALATAIELQNGYAQALQQSIDYQIKSAEIRANADIQLKEALGQRVTSADRNAVFDTRIRALTSTNVIPGGTTDPDQIFQQLISGVAGKDQQEKELARRNQQLAAAPTVDNRNMVAAQAQAISKQNVAINNSRKALEELANDSSKAANALKDLQEIDRVATGATNFTRTILTADSEERNKINKQLIAFTKFRSGRATGRDVNNLQFRQDVFAGGDLIKSVLPKELAEQLDAKLSLDMLRATPGGAKALQAVVGRTPPDAQGNQQDITLESALNMKATGRDPVQERYIQAYENATRVQATAADNLAKAAIVVADTFNNKMTETLTQIQQQLPTILEQSVTAGMSPAVAEAYKEMNAAAKQREALDVTQAASMGLDATGFNAVSTAYDAVETSKKRTEDLAISQANALGYKVSSQQEFQNVAPPEVYEKFITSPQYKSMLKEIQSAERNFGKIATAAGLNPEAAAEQMTAYRTSEPYVAATQKIEEKRAAFEAAQAGPQPEKPVGTLPLEQKAADTAAKEAEREKQQSDDDTSKLYTAFGSHVASFAAAVAAFAATVALSGGGGGGGLLQRFFGRGGAGTPAVGGGAGVPRPMGAPGSIPGMGAPAAGAPTGAPGAGGGWLSFLGKALAAAEIGRGAYVGATADTTTNRELTEGWMGETVGTGFNALTGALTGNTGQSQLATLAGIDENASYAQGAAGNLLGSAEAAGRGAAIGYQFGGPTGALVGAIAGLAGDVAKNGALLVQAIGDVADQTQKNADAEAKIKRQEEALRTSMNATNAGRFGEQAGAALSQLSPAEQIRARDEANLRIRLKNAQQMNIAPGDDDKRKLQDLGEDTTRWQSLDDLIAYLQNEAATSEQSRARIVTEEGFFSNTTRGADSPEFLKAVDELVISQNQSAESQAKTAKMADEATKPGSIYTHDIRTEGLLGKLISIVGGKSPDANDSKLETEISKISLQDVKKSGVSSALGVKSLVGSKTGSVEQAAGADPKLVEYEKRLLDLKARYEKEGASYGLATDFDKIKSDYSKDFGLPKAAQGGYGLSVQKAMSQAQSIGDDILKRKSSTIATKLPSTQKDNDIDEPAKAMPVDMLKSLSGVPMIQDMLSKVTSMGIQPKDVTASLPELSKKLQGLPGLEDFLSDKDSSIQAFSLPGLGKMAKDSGIDPEDLLKSLSGGGGDIIGKLMEGLSLSKQSSPISADVAKSGVDGLGGVAMQLIEKLVPPSIMGNLGFNPSTTTNENCECKLLAQILAVLQKCCPGGTPNITSTGINAPIPAPAPPGVNAAPVIQASNVAPQVGVQPQMVGPVQGGVGLEPRPDLVLQQAANNQATSAATQPTVTAEPIKRTEEIKLDEDRQKVIDASRKNKQREVEILKKQVEAARRNLAVNKANGATGEKSAAILADKEAKLASAEQDLAYINEGEAEELEQVRKAKQSRADLAGKQIQYTVRQTRPQTSSEPQKTLTPYESQQKAKRDAFEADKKARRQAYLSKFRPEVRENMMTDEEKAARDASRIAAQRVTQEGTTAGTVTPLTPQQQQLRQQFTAAATTPTSQPVPTPLQTTQTPQYTAQTVAADQGATATPQQYTLSLDPASLKAFTDIQGSFTAFGSYVAQLANIKLPDKIEITGGGTYTMDVNITGAAAMEMLQTETKKLAETFVVEEIKKLKDKLNKVFPSEFKASGSGGESAEP